MSADLMSPEAGSDLLVAWQQLLVNRSQPYAVQQADGSYRWIYAMCDQVVLAAHLAGELTLALSSTDARGWCKWVCLDADEPASAVLAQLVMLRSALAERRLPGIVEGSRRGGHLWLFLDEVLPAVEVRYVVLQALQQAAADLAEAGVAMPALDLYPEATPPGMLAHAMRVPLGVHRRTGRRYPLFDAQGQPVACDSVAQETDVADWVGAMPAVRWMLMQPRVSAAWIQSEWARFADAMGRKNEAKFEARARSEFAQHRSKAGDSIGGMGIGIGTRSPIIRWVDAHISPLDMLSELVPGCGLRRSGQGFVGWCPFHDDRAPDVDGQPGTPSFYVVHNSRYGWSWRCLSTHCHHSVGPMRHSFRLWQELLGLDVSSAIAAASMRWGSDWNGTDLASEEA